jgi:hypothetical protein
MADRMHFMIRVLKQRENDARLALARLARDVASKQATLAMADRAIATIDQNLRNALGSRYVNGQTRTVAELLESETMVRNLNGALEKLRHLRVAAQRELDETIARQQFAARQWKREEARLRHIEFLARRERIAKAVRTCEAEDEAHVERLAALSVAS